MKIDVRVVPEGHSQMDGDASLDGYKEDLPRLISPVRCSASIDRTGGTIAVTLHFVGEFEMECARCLESYSETMEGTLKIIIEEERGKRCSTDGDGADFFFGVNNEPVDVGSAIYDEIMVSLPIKPLCSEDCAGIRMQTTKSSQADGESIDSRWQVLKKLK